MKGTTGQVTLTRQSELYLRVLGNRELRCLPHRPVVGLDENEPSVNPQLPVVERVGALASRGFPRGDLQCLRWKSCGPMLLTPAFSAMSLISQASLSSSSRLELVSLTLAYAADRHEPDYVGVPVIGQRLDRKRFDANLVENAPEASVVVLATIPVVPKNMLTVEVAVNPDRSCRQSCPVTQRSVRGKLKLHPRHERRCPSCAN